MRKVIIATPAHDGRVNAEYAYSLAETVRMAALIGIDARILILPGEAIIQKARSELVRDALGAGVDDLIFIDSDQEWRPEWVLRLLNHQVDCVGGAVRKKSEAEAYNVSVKGDRIRVDQEHQLLVVDGLGTGFIRLSRRAMLVLWEAGQPYQDDFGKHCRWMFTIAVKDGRLVSEDINMATTLAQAGIQIYLDPSMTCSHIGRKKYTGDFQAYLRRLQQG